MTDHHGALMPGIGCELMLNVHHTTVLDVEFKSKKVTMVLSDSTKAFDTGNRSVITYKINNINTTGKNIKLLLNELENSEVQIAFNGKHSNPIIINNSLSQGHQCG